MELLRDGGAAVLRVAGDLDAATVATAEELVGQALESLDGADRLAVDLSATTFLDSTGLGFLVSVRARCQGIGLPLTLRDVPARLRRVLLLSGLDTLFERESTRPDGPEFDPQVVDGTDRPELFEVPDKASRPPAADARLERIAELTRRAVGASTAFVRLVDKTGQLTPGVAGLPNAPRLEPLDASFCKYVVTGGAPLVVENTRTSALLQDNPSAELFASYAGMPVTDHTGRVVGSLCVVDTEPRRWTKVQLDTLADLAEAASSELQLRSAVSRAAVAADRERFAQKLNEQVFGELLSLTMLLSSAQSISQGKVTELLTDAGNKVDDIVKRLRASIFDR